MSLEEALTANTAALAQFNANFDAFLKATKGGAAPASTTASADAPAEAKRGPGRPKKEEAAPKVSFDEMKAAILKVKDAKGKEAAEKIIKDVGGAAKMAEIKPEKFAAVLAASEAALTEPEADEGGGDDL